MRSYEEFLNFYEDHKKFPNGIYCPAKSLNEARLKTKYKAYVRSETKRIERNKKSRGKQMQKVIEKDQSWEETKQRFYEKRGKDSWDFLLERLPANLKIQLINNSNGLWKILDPAHILPKDIYPELKYNEDNIVWLNRYSHSNLDNLLNPITGKPINKHLREVWFIYMIGIEVYEKLLEKIENAEF